MPIDSFQWINIKLDSKIVFFTDLLSEGKGTICGPWIQDIINAILVGHKWNMYYLGLKIPFLYGIKISFPDHW